MAVLADFTIDSPLLRAALSAVPEASIEIAEYGLADAEAAKLFAWVTAPDLEPFEAALDDDPTVDGYERIEASSSRSFYRLRLSESESHLLTYRFAVRNDIVPLSARGTHEGWAVRARFPDREAIAEYWEYCRSVGVSFDLQQVSSAEDDPDPGTSDLTPPQREALVTALEAGYFDVPRGSTLESIADSIGISDTAASYRLRRGLKTLLEDSIDSTDSTGDPEDPPSPDDGRS